MNRMMRCLLPLTFVWTWNCSQPDTSESISKSIDQACSNPEHSNFQGAWIARPGRSDVRFAASQGFNCDTAFKIGSVSKNFTALAIMQLKEKGKLSIDDSIDNYIGTQDSISGKGLTLRDLLTHKSGINANIERDTSFNSMTNNEAIENKIFAAAGSGWRGKGRYQYNSVNYLILAAIARRVDGKQNFDEYLQEHIATPAGMTRTGLLVARLQGTSNSSFTPGSGTNLLFAGGAGGIFTTPRDMYLYNMALKSGKLIQESSLNEMVANSFGIEQVNKSSVQHGGSIDRTHKALFVTSKSMGNPTFFAGFGTDGQTRAVNLMKAAGF